MPTSKPSVNVTFSEHDREIMDSICRKEKVSMSTLIRNVMQDWLEEYEDMILARNAEIVHEKWEKSGSRTISHKELWKRLKPY